MADNLQVFLGKLEVTNEIGEQLDEQLQRVENTVQQLVGGGAALRLGANKVGELGSHVDRDLEAGKLQFTSELEVAAYVKKYIIRANEVLLNLAEKSKSDELVAHGKAAALKESMAVVKRFCTSAKSRAEQIVAANEELAKMAAAAGVDPAAVPAAVPAVDRGARLPGQHPGPSSLAERRAERDALRAQQGVQEATPVETQQTLPDPPAVEEDPPGAPQGSVEDTPDASDTRQKRPYKKRQKALAADTT